MAKSKYTQNITKMKCETCKRVNYYTRKNKKTTERKLELSKYCKWCHKRTPHKETKR